MKFSLSAVAIVIVLLLLATAVGLNSSQIQFDEMPSSAKYITSNPDIVANIEPELAGKLGFYNLLIDNYKIQSDSVIENKISYDLNNIIDTNPESVFLSDLGPDTTIIGIEDSFESKNQIDNMINGFISGDRDLNDKSMEDLNFNAVSAEMQINSLFDQIIDVKTDLIFE
jgi:hypothetical protein